MEEREAKKQQYGVFSVTRIEFLFHFLGCTEFQLAVR